jgi:hypothetical protein
MRSRRRARRTRRLIAELLRRFTQSTEDVGNESLSLTIPPGVYTVEPREGLWRPTK